ncbi:MAG TPA: hypothetical protein VFL82_05525 [Thermomicrobiales bacterium]|nr:hypothetical protein [Thermomicrobiales bacterium]
MQNSAILQQELADTLARERLAVADRRRVAAEFARGHRAPATARTRRAIGLAVSHLGIWVAGERWDPVVPQPSRLLR